jgi:hypothetical protein
MKVTKEQLLRVIKEELLREEDDMEGKYDILKGERPPRNVTGLASLIDPNDSTEASMTPNYEVELERIIHDMKSGGMSMDDITREAAEAIAFAFS